MPALPRYRREPDDLEFPTDGGAAYVLHEKKRLPQGYQLSLPVEFAAPEARNATNDQPERPRVSSPVAGQEEVKKVNHSDWVFQKPRWGPKKEPGPKDRR